MGGQSAAAGAQVAVHYSKRKGFRKLTGTMAEAATQVQSSSAAVRFVDACLRGYSQVFMINNPVTGIIIMIGILCDSWYRLLASLHLHTDLA